MYQCLHRLFEAQVARTPGRIAVRTVAEAVSYEDLNSAAERIASQLLLRGLRQTDIVAIDLPRGFFFVASILGVLKARGVILPLDPRSPDPYVTRIFQQAKPKFALTGAAPRPSIKAIPNIVVESIRQNSEDQLGDYLKVDSRAADPAYLLYTSGTQGQPKCVLGTHAPVSHFLGWCEREFPDRGQSFAFCSGLSHDPMMRDVFAPLTTGSCLHIPETETLTSSELVSWLVERSISTLHITPQLGGLIAGACELEGVAIDSIRYVFFGGDILSGALVKRLRDVCPQVKIVNFYGTTETPQAMSAYLVPSELNSGNVPIGRPIDGVRLSLDKANPSDPHGEIIVHTEFLSEGYFDDPKLTADRYRDTSEDNIRSYRTGDIGRETPDGLFLFLGRQDTQVKVRGHRVELDDVRQHLLAYPGVEEALVVADASGGDTSLTGYYTSSARVEVTEGQISGFLKDRLPEYMLPGELKDVGAFPLTPSGKIDRGRLPRPTRPVAGKGQARNALEADLLNIWRQVLTCPELGTHDNFFDARGDSLTGIELTARVQARIGEIVYILTLYEAPSVAEFADRLLELHPGTVREKYNISSTAGKEPGGLSTATIRKFQQLCCPDPVPDPSKAFVIRQPKPKASFILGAPRSGTTLLRVILSGHQQIFAPPALYMLQFSTLRQRAETYQSEFSFWGEGALSALMHAGDHSLEAARKHMEEMEEAHFSVQDFYMELNRMLGDVHVVDKTANYSISLPLLESMERLFDNPCYIYLSRHPGAVIHSFERSSLDQLFYSRLPHLRTRNPKPFGARELAELVWLKSNNNIQEFLADIPAERKRIVRYEDLVDDPQTAVADICDLLDVEFDPGMLQVYDDPKTRMTHGPGKSIMAGDPKFHQHASISKAGIDAWREHLREGDICQATWELAGTLGYKRRSDTSLRSSSHAIPLTGQPTGEQGTPLFCIYGIFLYRSLAEALGPEQSTYGLYIDEETEGLIGGGQDPGSGPNITDLARRYVERIREVQPRGPYQLIGASFAGVVAFEIARLLIEDGDKVHRLVFIDSLALSGPLRPAASPLRLFRRRWANKRKKGNPGTGNIDERGFHDNVRNLRKRIRKSARAGWKPVPLPVDVLLIRAEDHKWPRFTNLRDLGWGKLVEGELSQHWMPGTHIGILKKPEVLELAKLLRDYLLPAHGMSPVRANASDFVPHHSS